MEKVNKDSILINEVLIDGEKKLTVTSNTSVQPAALMRLGVFVPANKSNGGDEPIDASEALGSLELSQAEGYTKIIITGPRLNIAIDLKIWMGIIHAFSKYGLSSNTISLKFSEFASLCQIPSKRLDARTRASIRDSLTRIRAKTITLSTIGAKGAYITGLLKVGRFNADDDTIELEADHKLWELYRADYLTLLRKKPLNALPRQEAAQAIYTYLASLPQNPADISFTRLRARLMLTNRISDQNKVIRAALLKLKSIGYLDYLIKKEGKETYVKVLKRNPALTP
ncbi:RepB family plasmid replication initiator protein [Pantoea agglomerans]|uniref:RepB family plasmid replication initiator protein n=1 Tax=Enterobacter agglomerans TaxID=549 RepID=UPI0013D0BF09|nr:RepB family plasmid replication initiator protein [Pantoea agglomerans]NEG59685.1 protein RepA [Pantoea agglomerans]